MSQLPQHKQDVGPGWHPLLDQLHEELIVFNPDYKVAQVKEKWGLLRVYIDGTPIRLDILGPDRSHATIPMKTTGMDDNWKIIQRIVNRYEEMSSHICEDCGDLGELDTSHYWIRTLCPACRSTRS